MDDSQTTQLVDIPSYFFERPSRLIAAQRSYCFVVITRSSDVRSPLVQIGFANFFQKLLNAGIVHA